MLTAFVMIKTEPQRIAAVAQAVAELPSVAESFSVTGEYDIVAILKLAEYDQLAEAVPEGITCIPGVTATTTILAFRRFAKKDLDVAWDIGLS